MSSNQFRFSYATMRVERKSQRATRPATTSLINQFKLHSVAFGGQVVSKKTPSQVTSYLTCPKCKSARVLKKVGRPGYCECKVCKHSAAQAAFPKVYPARKPA